MWFPVDDGMINLDRVAYIEVESYAVVYYNDARAVLTTATFSSKEDLENYVTKLQKEISYPLVTGDSERFPDAERHALLDVADKEKDESDE
jgi:hypothetical protein